MDRVLEVFDRENQVIPLEIMFCIFEQQVVNSLDQVFGSKKDEDLPRNIGVLVDQLLAESPQYRRIDITPAVHPKLNL